MFSGSGRFPLRRLEQRIDTRKALRSRINRAIAAGVLEPCEAEFVNPVDPTATEIPNAAPDPTKHLDIPLLAWQLNQDRHIVLIPPSWRSSTQIHPSETFRLSKNFESTKGRALKELGETILGGVNRGLDNYVEQETKTIWNNLQDHIIKQHSETKQIDMPCGTFLAILSA